MDDTELTEYANMLSSIIWPGADDLVSRITKNQVFLSANYDGHCWEKTNNYEIRIPKDEAEKLFKCLKKHKIKTWKEVKQSI